MARSKPHRLRILLVVAGVALVALAALAALWVVYLDRVVTRDFQGRLWSVPARVYAEPLDLYAGAPVTADDLEEDDDLNGDEVSHKDLPDVPGPQRYRRRLAFKLCTRPFTQAPEYTDVRDEQRQQHQLRRRTGAN